MCDWCQPRRWRYFWINCPQKQGGYFESQTSTTTSSRAWSSWMLDVLSTCTHTDARWIQGGGDLQKLAQHGRQTVAPQPGSGRSQQNHAAHQSLRVRRNQRNQHERGRGYQVEHKYHLRVWKHKTIYEILSLKSGQPPKENAGRSHQTRTHKRRQRTLKEYATKAEHIRAMPKGVRSTTTQMNRGRPKQTPLDLEREATAVETAATPIQVQGNKKPRLVFMTTVLADNWIESNQTGAFPWMSNKGHKYICVFYIFDPNFIKGAPIKSRHKEELLRARQEVYKWYEARGFKPQLHKMDNETSKDIEGFIVGQQKVKLQYTASD